MFKYIKSNHFESKIHLGLLAIIFILLFINFTSNYIIYRAKETKRQELTDQFNNAALAINRIVEDINITSLSEEQERKFKQDYQLRSVKLFPTQPENNSMESKRLWFATIISKLPAYEVPEFAEKLLTSNFKTVTRANGEEYYFVDPVTTKSGRYLLVLSRNNHELAYFDNSQRLVFITGIIASIMMALIYLFLSRSIFSPFRRIRDEAKQAGREIKISSDDADAIVAEYSSVINELKEKEQQLLKLNKKITHEADSLKIFNNYLLASIRSGIITVNNDGEIITINNAAQVILNIELAEMKGKSYKSLFEGDNPVTKMISDSLNKKVDQKYQEIEFGNKDTQRITIGITSSIITDNNKDAIGAALLMNDLSEITQLRKELVNRQKLATLGEMTGGLAHQLRNSMGAMSGYLTLLKRRSEKKGYEDDSIEALINESREAQALVERFLHFSKPLQLNCETHIINELIKEVVDSIQVRDMCKKITFKIPNKPVLSVELDGLLLKQALTNIVENSINAYDCDEGTVSITLEVSESDICIKIQDYGCGIKPDDLDKIFTPFYSSRPSGCGLGLPLASKIVNMHLGKIFVESEPGTGTTFSIILPCNKAISLSDSKNISQTASIS